MDLKVQVKNEESFPNLQNLNKNRGGEPSPIYQGGEYIRRVPHETIQGKVTQHSLEVSATPTERSLKCCSSLFYCNPFDLHTKFQWS